MRISKRVLSTILICGIAVGLLTVGVLMKPVMVEAEDASTIASNSFVVDENTFTAVNIPTILEVNNITTAANGESAYIPAFDAYIVAKPLTDENNQFHPYDFATSDFPGSGKWISGKFALAASTTVTFGNDKIYSFDSADFGFCPEWFTGKTGMYRYQIYLYDDTANSFGGMFTLPTNDSDGNRIFLDFYVNGGNIYGVVLVDEDNHKLVSSASSPDSTVINTTDTKPTIGAGTTIKYNVADVTISNSIIERDGRNSPFHYTAAFGSNLTGGAIMFDNDTQTNATGTYTSSPKQYTIDEKYGDFSYTIINCPVGLEMTVTQTSPKSSDGKLQVYVSPTAKIADLSGYTKDNWAANTPNTYTATTSGELSSQLITISATESDATNKVSFVNVAVLPLPPTGITTTVLPFVILIVLAGGLLTFFVRRKEVEG